MRWTRPSRSRCGISTSLFDADRGCVFDIGSRDGGNGASGARDDQGRGRGGSRGDTADAQDGVYGSGDVSEDVGSGSGGGQRRGIVEGGEAEEVERGQVVAKPGSITPHRKFKAEMYILTKEEGGRHTPFFNGYRPQYYFRTTDVTGAAKLPEGVEMVMPGDNVSLTVELITPIAMEKELRFAIREGGRTVGAGVISDIIE